jgi:energy-coupling factor transporter ATP-binding protein EcfA2
MIAMALACEPKLLIADEPTTALDVTIQAQILKLLRDLQDRLAMGILLITHDLGVVAEMVDEVAVMHAHRVAERAPRTGGSCARAPCRLHPDAGQADGDDMSSKAPLPQVNRLRPRSRPVRTAPATSPATAPRCLSETDLVTSVQPEGGAAGRSGRTSRHVRSRSIS